MKKRTSVVMAFRLGGRKIKLKIADQREKIRAARALRPKKPRKSPSRMRAFGINRKRYIAAIPVLVALIILAWVFKYGNVQNEHYRPLDASIVNPLMGWAVDAENNPSEVMIDHSLVYATVTWRELEPEKGVYDFESFEKKNRLNEWWDMGKRAVLRFVMDKPGDEAHMDIPDWLYSEMGDEAGGYYENTLGKGFSPNYTDIRLKMDHRDVIMALGERYDDHPGIAYIEIGSVGHNGAWEVQDVTGGWPLPPNEDITNWIWHYTRAFTKTRLLAPKPYQSVRVTGMGLYNERLGNQSATWDWIDTIEYGGYDEATDTLLRATPEVLGSTLSSARIDSSLSQSRLFTLGLDSLVKQLRYCRVTYASGVTGRDLSEAEKSGMDLARCGMGYRLWVRQASWLKTIRAGYCFNLDLDFRNDGVEGFMYLWPLEVSLLKDGEVAFSANVDCDIRKILPGSHRVMLQAMLPVDLDAGEYDVGIAVLDPRTGEPCVELEMDAKKVGLRTVLGRVEVVGG